MESLSTPGHTGLWIRNKFSVGLFRQEIGNGYQKERSDQWLYNNSPWIIERSGETCTIPVYGRIDPGLDRWVGCLQPDVGGLELIVGEPHDVPVAGYGGATVNYMRLYSARASDEFDMQIFNEGD